MPERVVYRDGLWNGRPLTAWIPDVVRDILAVVDPVRIVLFGSAARGDHAPDSDLDVLVVLPEPPPSGRRQLMRRLVSAIQAPVPVDVLITDLAEIARRGHLKGWILYQALHHDGVVLYERAA